MAISRDIQNHLSKGDFESIDNDWLARSEDDPANLDYFVGVARALSGSGEEERARFLLELLDEQLVGRQLWAERLKMLRRVGHLLTDAKGLHPKLMKSLEGLHGESSSYEGLVEQLGLMRGTHDIPKIWDKADRLEVLVTFDVGAAVLMEGKGAGRVAEVNFGLESLKVDFDRIKGMTVGFRAAAKLLKPLPRGHVLARKQREPELLEALVKDDPPELLRAVLESFDRPLKAAEIREALAGVLSEKGWTSWWTAARKHPQVLTGSGGKQTYSWAATGEDAAEAAWAKFRRAADREKIELLRRDGQRDPDLGERMMAELETLGAAAAGDDPGLAFEIWCALERGGRVLDDVPWSPRGLVAPPADPRRVATSIQDRALRERAFELIRAEHENWPDVYLDLIGREGEPKLLGLLADALAAERPAELARFEDRLASQPRKNVAAFGWLAERAAEHEALRERNPLGLLRSILQSLDDEAFGPLRVRLRALVETGGTVPRLLQHLSEDQAPQAEELIERASGLEGYQRDAMRTALELRFESLRKQEEAPLYALTESIEAKRTELNHLKRVELPANRKAIEEARAMGDLRENFEYKSARQRHEYLSARLAALSNELSRVQPLDPSPPETSDVRIGTRVRLKGAGEPITYTILGPWESKPEEHVISYQSELGQSLLGKKRGEAVEVSGESFEIEEIEAYS